MITIRVEGEPKEIADLIKKIQDRPFNVSLDAKTIALSASDGITQAIEDLKQHRERQERPESQHQTK